MKMDLKKILWLNLYLLILLFVSFYQYTIMQSTVLDQFQLTFNQLKDLKVWTIFSYSFYTDHLLFLFLFAVFYYSFTLQIQNKIDLKRWYLFIVQSVVVSGLFHLIFSRDSTSLYGVYSLFISLVLIRFRLFYNHFEFKLLNRRFSISTFVFFMVIIDLIFFALQKHWSSSSFPSYLGAIIFSLAYPEKKLIHQTFEPYKDHSFQTAQKPLKVYRSNKNAVESYNNSKSERSFPTDSEIDKILDKISSNGLSSLTDEEKRKLKLASQHKK